MRTEMVSAFGRVWSRNAGLGREVDRLKGHLGEFRVLEGSLVWDDELEEC